MATVQCFLGCLMLFFLSSCVVAAKTQENNFNVFGRALSRSDKTEWDTINDKTENTQNPTKAIPQLLISSKENSPFFFLAPPSTPKTTAVSNVNPPFFSSISPSNSTSSFLTPVSTANTSTLPPDFYIANTTTTTPTTFITIIPTTTATPTVDPLFLSSISPSNSTSSFLTPVSTANTFTLPPDFYIANTISTTPTTFITIIPTTTTTPTPSTKTTTTTTTTTQTTTTTTTTTTSTTTTTTSTITSSHTTIPTTTPTHTLPPSTTPSTTHITTTTTINSLTTTIPTTIFTFHQTSPSTEFHILHHIIENYGFITQHFDSLFLMLERIDEQLDSIWQNAERLVFAFEGSQVQSPTIIELSWQFHKFFEGFSELSVKPHNIKINGKLNCLELHHTFLILHNDLQQLLPSLPNITNYERKLLAATSEVFFYYTTTYLMGINEEDYQQKRFLKSSKTIWTEDAPSKTSVMEEGLLKSLTLKFLPSPKEKLEKNVLPSDIKQQDFQMSHHTFDAEQTDWQRVLHRLRSLYNVLERVSLVSMMSKALANVLDNKKIKKLEELSKDFEEIEKFSFMHYLKFRFGHDQHRLASFWMSCLVVFCTNAKDLAISLEVTMGAIPTRLSSIIFELVPTLIREIEKESRFGAEQSNDYWMQQSIISLLRDIIEHFSSLTSVVR